MIRYYGVDRMVNITMVIYLTKMGNHFWCYFETLKGGEMRGDVDK